MPSRQLLSFCCFCCCYFSLSQNWCKIPFPNVLQNIRTCTLLTGSSMLSWKCLTLQILLGWPYVNLSFMDILAQQYENKDMTRPACTFNTDFFLSAHPCDVFMMYVSLKLWLWCFTVLLTIEVIFLTGKIIFKYKFSYSFFKYSKFNSL